MLTDKPILIVQDNIYRALDLAAAIEGLNGRVVGPAGTVFEALALLGDEPVAAAVIDAELPDSSIAPLLQALTEKRLPYVIETSRNLPPGIMMLGKQRRF